MSYSVTDRINWQLADSNATLSQAGMCAFQTRPTRPADRARLHGHQMQYLATFRDDTSVFTSRTYELCSAAATLIAKHRRPKSG